MADTLRRARLEHERIEPLLQPIWASARQPLSGGDRRRAYLSPTESEEQAHRERDTARQAR